MSNIALHTRTTAFQSRGQKNDVYYSSKPETSVENLLVLLKKLGLSVDDAVEAVVSRVGPAGIEGMLSNWKKLRHFNFSAPQAKVVEEVFNRADFKCEECDTQLRLSIDHRDLDSTNHAKENLGIKCMPCNQGYEHIKTSLTLAALELFDELGKFPSEAEVLNRAGLEKIGSYRFYVMTYLRKRFEACEKETRIKKLVEDFRKVRNTKHSDKSTRLTDIFLELYSEAAKVHGDFNFQDVFDKNSSPMEHVECLATMALGRKHIDLQSSNDTH